MAITDSLARFSASVLETLHTRLSLLSLETEVRMAHYVQFLLWSLIALFFASIAVILCVLLVVVCFWDTHRELAIISMAAAFFILAGGIAIWLKNVRASQPTFLQLSLQELESDINSLRGTRNAEE